MREIRLPGRAVHWLRYFGPIPVLLILLPLADFRLNIGPPRPWGTPFLTSLVVVVAMLLVFRSSVPGRARANVVFATLVSCASAGGYITLSSFFVGERVYAGENQRVVLGFRLQPELEEQIQDDTRREIARLNKIRDTAFNLEASDFYGAKRNSISLGPAKTEEDIRLEAVEQLIARTGDPSAPYTAWSRRVIALALLALWELTFAGVASAIALLAPTLEAVNAR